MTKEVQQRWGDQYKIVTADGLDLEDCEGTRGEYKIDIILYCSFVLSF